MNKNNIVLTMLLCATVHVTMAHANQGKSITMSNQSESKAQQVKQAVYDAYQAMRLDHNEVGIQILQDSLKQYPNEENLLKNLALAFYKNRQYKTATGIYHQLLVSNPHNDSILNNYMAALSAESPGNAIDQIKPIQSFYPKNHLIPAQLGVLCSKMGRNSQAIYYYTEAIKIEPKIDYKYNLAVLLDKSNETTGALLLYQDIAKMFSQGFIDNSMYGIPIDSVLARIEYLSKNTQHSAKTKKA